MILACFLQPSLCISGSGGLGSVGLGWVILGLNSFNSSVGFGSADSMFFWGLYCLGLGFVVLSSAGFSSVGFRSIGLSSVGIGSVGLKIRWFRFR